MNKHFRRDLMPVLLSLALLGGCGKTQDTQTALETKPAGVPPAAVADNKPPEGALNPLESLVAPIALYPDPLLAELLVAATYPAEIAAVARRLEAEAAPDAADNLGLNASIQRLAALPPVIIMLQEHPLWTAALGDAFLAVPDELLAAIQKLRRQAFQTGILKNSTAQSVVERHPAAVPDASHAAVSEAGNQAQHAIVILPAKANKVQMPLYDAEKVFNAALAPHPDSGAISEPTAEYYPAYFPPSDEPGESGGTLVFAGNVAVSGLMTWGSIEWRNGQGFNIAHVYGSLIDCRDSDDCWLLASDNGYNYRDELRTSPEKVVEGEGAVNLSSGPIKAWRHDPRHRRGLPYPESVARLLGGPAYAPLAGQHLAASTIPWQERGFNAPPGVQSEDEADEESLNAANGSYAGEITSIFNGVTDNEASSSTALQRGIASRNRDKSAVPQSVPVPEAVGSAEKQASKPAELHKVAVPLPSQEDFLLPGIFAGSADNVRLTVRYSRRGAESRAPKPQLTAKVPASLRTKSIQENTE